MLYPFDIKNICAHLTLTSTEFHQQYSVFSLDETQLERCLLRNRPDCPFRANRQCQIYPSRPIRCRLYPLGRYFETKAKAGTGEDILLTNDEALALLRRQVKQLEDAMVDFQKGNRADLVEKTQAEVAIIKAYLPQGMTDAELEPLVDSILQELGEVSAKDLGKIMGAVMKKAGGRADGNKVREMVSKKLGG